MRDRPTQLAGSAKAERALPPLALQAGMPLALVLVVLFALASEARAESRTTGASKELAGHGRTEADAEQDAFSQARDWVVGLLRDRKPSLSWEPSVAYLREAGLARRRGPASPYPSDSLGPLLRVAVHVEIDEAAMRKLVQQDRLHQRHLLAAKILAGLVAVLITLAVYFRLEETTRGYYAAPLRTGLVVCLGAVAAGLWFTW